MGPPLEGPTRVHPRRSGSVVVVGPGITRTAWPDKASRLFLWPPGHAFTGLVFDSGTLPTVLPLFSGPWAEVVLSTRF